ncbi:MAG TPA: 2TM domain-containing protein [Nocardioides sp.]|jgi:2TM domain-containing protein|nr:2TM domain-containing protein [Nocardioides sp.]
MTETGTEPNVREAAARRLEKRRGFTGHLLVYLLVNTAFVVIWLITGHPGFFWPVFLMVFWGIGLVMNAWDVFVAHEITEEDIDREVARMHHR